MSKPIQSRDSRAETRANTVGALPDYQPKHRDSVRTEHAPTMARCTHPIGSVDQCTTWQHGCPRHQPRLYAEMLARHASDSIYPAPKGRSGR